MSNREAMSATKKGTFILAIVLLAIEMFPKTSFAQERKCEGDCGGKYHGKSPTEKELKQILTDHAKWVQTVYIPATIKDPKVRPEDLPQEGRANLCEAKLSKANLSSAVLAYANLSGADLSWANLSEDMLSHADLSKANLWGADLSGANLMYANLSKAYLLNANLSGADLMNTNLSGAYLRNTNLNGTYLLSANLDSVTFELEPGKPLPLITGIVFVKNLSRMQFLVSPHSLLELREAFKKAGLRQQEREITYAIERTNRRQQLILGYEGVAGIVNGFFERVMFGLTANYGMSPGRPLLIMQGLIFVFAFPYWFALLKREGRAGIWKVWEKERILQNDGQEKPVRLHISELRLKGVPRAIHFSILSAFYIGWRELNIGHWIIRMQPHEYTLRATGWVRAVSGVQSLISVYLLALSILTYFGRPFE